MFSPFLKVKGNYPNNKTAQCKQHPRGSVWREEPLKSQELDLAVTRSKPNGVWMQDAASPPPCRSCWVGGDPFILLGSSLPYREDDPSSF